jgi:uncharacterized protein
MNERKIERIVLVPRWSGTAASDCYPWLARELAARAPGLGLEVVPLLPEPDRPEIEPCVAACLETLGKAEAARTVLVGHSVGCQVAMRTLARLPDDARVAALLCIAGWWTVDRPWETLLPWSETPFDHGRAAGGCDRAVVLLSDNDPFTSDFAETARRFEAALNAEIKISSGRRHFNAPEEPDVLAALVRLAGV